MSDSAPTGRPLDGRSVCILTTLHPSANPRVLKEADALSEAGARVRVVSLASETLLAARDRTATAGRPWRHEAIDARPGGPRWALRCLAQAWARRRRHPWSIARRASRFVDDLFRRGAARPADLYIAHTLGALPAAWRCAERHGGLLGYDAEDFESGIEPGGRDAPALECIERAYLPRCGHLTAASDGIGALYAERVGIERPLTVLNVFPWSHREVAVDTVAERSPCALSLYWYSQTIGPIGGLEDALEALGMLPDDVHLHLRGRWAQGYEAQLRARTRALAIGGRVHHRPLVDENELVARAAVHDVGLALEVPASPNRRVCLTNKLFAYLLAGVAVAASDTPAQRLVLQAAPAAGGLYAPGDVAALAALIRGWREDPDALARARAAALDAARARWRWELESPRLVRSVAAALDEARR